ncbi:protein shisa-4 isoform X2 [Periplaneta americana]|uniref:protein shisa-4 isoform X2 n=1 Tax=Periplaneta americana TaxID=6978 RepID=UPI0037E93349
MATYWFSVVFVSVLFLSTLRDASSMECELGHESTLLEQLNIINPKSCPTFVDSSDKIYCCKDGDRVYCCNDAQFVSNGFGVLLPVFVIAAVGLLIVFCLCCLCCPCCLLYKRRHRGTVYGRVQTVVATSHTIQQQAPVYPPQPTPMPMPSYSQPTAYPAMYPPQAGQQPPPYSEATTQEVYSKQAPYNPNFQ